MKKYLVPVLFIGIILFFFFPIKISLSYAQALSSSDSSSATISAVNSLDSKSSTNLVITTIEDFLKSLDNVSGGLIFTTPDLFSEAITFTNGTVINGLSIYRNFFYLLSVPISAIIIFWFGVRRMGNQKLYFLQQFAVRIFIYIFFLLFLVPILSFSIQAENMFTKTILSVPSVKEKSVISFATDYFSAVNQEISTGKASPESFGFFNPSMFDVMRSVTHVIAQLLLLIFVLFTLVFAIIFIFMQFVIRFLSLLFLSLVFPIVSPFILSEETEGVVNNYLKLWFTFLIHQPSFVLGYTIIMIIVRSMLQSGASIGVLLIYIGSLFFLGTINILAARIFADFWVAAGLNFEAATVTGRLLSFPQKLLWKQYDKYFPYGGKVKQIGPQVEMTKREINGEKINKNPNFKSEDPAFEQKLTLANSNISNSSPKSLNLESYSNEFAEKGFTASLLDKKQGVVSIEGTGYTYYDKNHGMSYIYPSQEDAIASGISPSDIHLTTLSKRNYIDLSQFKKGENPYNAFVAKEAMRMNKPSNYAHLTKRSDPKRIKHFFEINKEKNESLGVEGVIVKRYDNFEGKRSVKATTRIIQEGNI